MSDSREAISSNQESLARTNDRDAPHEYPPHYSEKVYYDLEASREKTDYVLKTSNSTTTDETIRFTVEELPADEDFKTRFFEAQDRLGELEQELRNTREKLRNLENACENTEEKIGVLKNAAFSYHRTFSEHEITIKTVVEENNLLKTTIEKLETTIRVYKEEQEKADEIKRDNDNLKDQLDEARKENDELVAQLDKFQMDSNDLRDNIDDDKVCKHCGRGDNILTLEMESLKLKYDEIETENDKLQKEKEELRDEVNDLEKQLKDLKIKLSADDEVIEEMKHQILDYHVQVNQLEENCDNSRTRNIELEKEMSILRGLVAELESNLEAEKNSHDSMIREGSNRLEIQNKKIIQLEMNLKEVCKEKELLYLQFVDSKNKAEMDSKQWTKQLNEAHVRAELFRKEVSDKEKIIFALKAENEELKDDIALLQKQLEDAQDRDLSKFADELDRPDGDEDDERERLKKENEELTQELEQLRDEVISLQSELAEKYMEEEKNKEEYPDRVVVHHVPSLLSAPLAPIANDEDLSDFDELEEERIVAVGETPNLAALPKESGDSWSSQDYSKSQIQELEELLERTKKEKEKVEECLEESEERAEKTTDELSKTITQLNERCEEMRKELVEKEMILNKLRKDQMQDKNTISDLEEKLREQEYLEAELEKARKELLELKSQETNEDLREEYDKLKGQYEKILEEKKKLKEENEDLSEKKADVEEELEEMNVKFDKGKQMYNALCDENDDLKKDNDDLKKEIEKLKDEVKYLGDELKEEEDLHINEKEKLTAKNNELEDQNRRLEGEISDLKLKLRGKEDDDNWRHKHDELKREKGSLQIEKQRLERNLERNEDEHEQTKTKYNKVRRELNDANSETSTLRRQLSELKLAKDTGDLEKELRKLKETLRKKEEECKRHLAELEELKRSLFRQTSEEGWQEKFESLKLKLDEVEDEKDSLQKEKNNLQNDLRKDSEKLAELEIKLSQANMEIEGLSKDFDKSHTRITHLEIELQRASKQKQQAEEQAKWIKKELLTREETISKLGKELNEKNSMIDGMEDNDKDNHIIMLEREIQLLQSRIPASEKDESVLHNRIRFLEDNVKDIREKLDGKTAQLDECEKQKESLSVHVVELSKEIQSLYKRYEASRAEVAELLAGRPVAPEKAETTSLTIDVEGKSEVQLGVFVQERVRSRVVTPGLGRSTSEIEIPVSQMPGTVVIGEPVAVIVDYSAEGSPVVSHPIELTASEPDDNDEETFSRESDEDVPPVVYTAPEVESAPELPYSPPSSDPERILVSAQALPRPQLPKSIDPERFPFIKGSGVRLSGGAFQPVPSRNNGQPEETREQDLSDKEQLPTGRFRAYSREEQFKLDGLLHAHAHHHEPTDEDNQPPENGVDNADQEYPREPNAGDEGWPEPPPYDWEEAPVQPPREAYSYQSAPGEEYPDDYDGQPEQYPDPYQVPPRKPESSYQRRIIGVYDNDGKLIGYQEVYEEITDEYADEMNGGVVPYPEPHEHGEMPHPYEPGQRPWKKIPYSNDTRQPAEDELQFYEFDRNRNATNEKWFSHQPDDRGTDNRTYSREGDRSYGHGYPGHYGYVNGDGARRNRPPTLANQYASGTYL